MTEETTKPTTEETKPTRGKSKKVLEREKDTLLSDMRKAFSLGRNKQKPNQIKALNDLQMLDGDQWDFSIAAVAERRDDGRPCLTVNLLPKFQDQVEGDQRMNRPASKVHPRDSGADIEGAELRDGLLRGIKAFSFADVAYDTAFQHASQCGFGFFRVVTEYAADDIFEQDIKFKPIYNNFAVVWDASAQEWDLSDAMDLWILTRVSKDVFKRKYPKANTSSFPDTDESYTDWVDDKSVTVAEWFRKEPVKKRLYRIPAENDPMTGDEIVNSRVVFEDDMSEEDRAKATTSRVVDTYEIWRYLTNGIDFLEDKQLWPASIWPVIPVWGKEIRINGQVSRRGVIRNAIEPQRIYNYMRSTQVELIALSPKAPLILTADQAEGHETQLQNMGRKAYPYVVINHDPQAPGWPQRVQPALQSSAVTEGLQLSSEEMKSTTGLYDASIGARSNETSGKAIEARDRQGDVGSFAFIDNLGRSIQLGDRLVLELLPRVYDTPRALRAMGVDGSVTMVDVNKPQTDMSEGIQHKILNDLTAGKYDVTVTMGPSYTTQRQEAADSMLKFLQVDPSAGPLIADLICKNLDWPGAQEIAQRLKIRVPPQALTQEEREEMAKNAPKPEPQEPPPPDPKLLIEMEKLNLAHLEHLRKDFETQTNAILTFARAEAAEQGVQLQAMTQLMQALHQQMVPQGQGGMPGGQQPGNGGQPRQMPSGGQMIEGRAQGGPVEAGQPYMVGEMGEPELFVPQQDGVVIPNQMAKAVIPQVPGAPLPSSLHDRLFPPSPTPEQVQEMIDQKFLYWDESGQSLVDKEGNTVYRMEKGEPPQ